MQEAIPVLVGPTAVGKSELALGLARALQADILSCDSRQVFRDMVIGTAAPDAETRARVRHHFVGERDPDNPWSAGRFKQEAEDRIHTSHAAGRRIVVVGGSTLYVSALVNGIARTPAVPPEIRDALNAELELNGPEALYKQLLDVDPDYAASLDETKSQRIVRGLEVYTATGRTLSSYQADHEGPAFRYRVYVLHRERNVLYDAINRRVDTMMAQGLLQEVSALAARDFNENSPAMRTIGYQELFPVLRGDTSLETAVDAIKQASRRYAKRQLTWLRRMKDAEWIDVDSLAQPAVVDYIARDITSRN